MKKYRLKDEKFRKPAQAIANYAVGGGLPLEHFVLREGSVMRSRLEEYGVFELWFEEVHPEFKSGDYIYIIATGNIYEIDNCEVMENQLHWNAVGMDRGYKYRFSTLLSNIRHATAEEIEEYKQQLPSISGFEGGQKGDYIIYGCKRVHIQDFIKLYEACMCMDVAVNAIAIEGYKVEMETIKEIYEKIHSL